ncbi:hypothetical protein Mapa_017516 [Marchantia paleacea]|nr:hypothetical protein Mapa_017516 [Marchantia paleacea]
MGCARRDAWNLHAARIGYPLRLIQARWMMGSSSRSIACLCVILILSNTSPSYAGITSRYVRKLAASEDLPEDNPHVKAPEGYNAPQQVHIHQGDYEGTAVIVSWVTQDEPGDGKVLYGQAQENYTTFVIGEAYSYSFYNYTSGFIHHAKISGLQFDTKYFYTIGSGNVSREFWFITPPESKLDTPYTFGVIGDLGQTFDSLSTLEHYMNSSGQSVLFVGDLSYADTYPVHNNIRWDTWSRLVEPSAAFQPWILTAGNHELDFLPEFVSNLALHHYLHVVYLLQCEKKVMLVPLGTSGFTI